MFGWLLVWLQANDAKLEVKAKANSEHRKVAKTCFIRIPLCSPRFCWLVNVCSKSHKLLIVELLRVLLSVDNIEISLKSPEYPSEC